MEALSILSYSKGGIKTMNVALQEKNVYEDFDPRTDTLFFKLGTNGVIIFHGRNYNIKRRMTADERNHLISDTITFIRISSDCYVNLQKILSIEEDHLVFEEHFSIAKRLSCSKRVQTIIRQKLASKGQ